MLSIEAERVTRRFGAFTAVNAVSFLASAGEILAFLGPNGAGKTTLFKMIMGLLRPTSGRIVIRGDDEERRGKAESLLGYMSQRFSLFPLLTAGENLAFLGGIAGLPPAEIRGKKAQFEDELPSAIRSLKVRDLPTGFRQKLALFACLMAGPKIILLDEPTAGAGPVLRRAVWSELQGLKKDGRVVLVATHHLPEAELADRVLIVNDGRLVLEGRPSELVRSAFGRTMADVYGKALSDEPRI